MHIHISTTDGVPIYLQIANQVKYLIAAGRLQAGQELPPIRTLADQLLINPNTVARAYRELQSAGILAVRRTSGTYVSAAGSPLARAQRRKKIVQRIDALLAEARQLDISTDEVVNLLRVREKSLDPRVQPGAAASPE